MSCGDNFPVTKARASLLTISIAATFSLYCLFTPSVALGAVNDVTRIERAIEGQVSAGKFSGAVLVSKNGKILVNRGYGSANLDWNIPNTPSTKFHLGSVTKQFTAACILLLEERGRLKTGEFVRRYLPNAPAAWDQVTIFNLLTHTSGIPDYTGFPDFRTTLAIPATPAQLVARFRDKPLEFEPGSQFEYSNSNYVLLGYLIELLSGEPYSKFVQDNIFAPLGMRDSGYDSNTRIIARRAVGYMPAPSGPIVGPYIDMSLPYSAGSLYSTTNDLFRWEQALYGGRVLTAPSLKKMTTPFLSEYALGLSARKTPNGYQLFWHNGGGLGFANWVGYLPAKSLDVIVLGNLTSPGASDIGNEIVRIADGEE